MKIDRAKSWGKNLRAVLFAVLVDGISQRGPTRSLKNYRKGHTFQQNFINDHLVSHTLLSSTLVQEITLHRTIMKYYNNQITIYRTLRSTIHISIHIPIK